VHVILKKFYVSGYQFWVSTYCQTHDAVVVWAFMAPETSSHVDAPAL